MNRQAIASLRCPFCRGGIRLASDPEPAGNRVDYGLLQCLDCRVDFPIVAGIAILFGPTDRVDVKAETTVHTISSGPRVSDLAALIRRGELTHALSLLLMPASDKGELFPPLHVRETKQDPVERVLPPRGLFQGRPTRNSLPNLKIVRRARRAVRSALLPRAKRRLADFLRSHASELSALDVIQLYYEAFSRVEMFNYFAFRFGQPRHLAALSLISLFRRTQGPVLDLACGMGHLTFHLTETFPGRVVFALDRDFFRLYVARRYVAPNASFICAPADQALPFAAGTFSGVFCSDAFHYFLHRASSVREMLRVLDSQGTLVLSRFGNGDVEPREGYELTIDGYERLFEGTDHIFLGEDDLVTRYLDRRGPDLESGAPRDSLKRQKWISLVAGRDLSAHPPVEFDEWPHAKGRLQLNPIYSPAPTPAGGCKLTFHFPSKWYAFENEKYAQYAAPECEISQSDLLLLSEGRRSPRIDDLVNRFVVLSLPETFVHAARGDHRPA
jgi:SAM-dependent methyltransferase